MNSTRQRRILVAVTCRMALALPALAALLSLGGCASGDDNAALEDRLESRNSAYDNFIDRRTMRREARDERYNRWWDSW